MPRDVLFWPGMHKAIKDMSGILAQQHQVYQVISDVASVKDQFPSLFQEEPGKLKVRDQTKVGFLSYINYMLCV